MKVASNIIYTVRTQVQPEHEEEFNEWQNTEHVPWIFRVDGYRSNQRFRNVQEPFKYMNLWEIESLAAHDSPEKMSVSKTPWGQRMFRFRKLRVSFYRQFALVDHRKEQDNQFELLSYITWEPLEGGEAEEEQWIRQELLPIFEGDENILGVRLFELLRGTGKRLLMTYIRKKNSQSNSLVEKAYSIICKRAGTAERELYQPMGPAIYKN